MIIPPSSSHPPGTDVVWNDVAIVRELSLADGANAVLCRDLPVHQLAHFGVGPDLPISARMLGIVDAADCPFGVIVVLSVTGSRPQQARER